MHKVTSNLPAETLALYDALIAAFPETERRGASMPYTSLNGQLFSFLTAEGRLALRLPAGEREAFLARYGTALVEQHGSARKEYVAVPEALLARAEELRPFFAASVAYVGALKPTKAKKSA